MWLQYQLDELYEIRSEIAHGSVFFSESTTDRIVWTFERYVRKQKGTWTREAVKISNGYLASVYYSASLLKNFLVRLKKCLEDVSNFEEEYQKDKEIRRNRRVFAELISFGHIVDDNGLVKAFPLLNPVE